MPTFVGLDLAWTTYRDSGVCWLQGEKPGEIACTRLEAVTLQTEDIAREIASVEGPIIVAIDALLLYTPERWVEREIARRFARYHAAPHQAHYAVRQGYTAGIDLARKLEAQGLMLDPTQLLGGKTNGRFAVEVFPHTIHVRLFDLEERLPYKSKTRRSVATQRDAMQRYQLHLHDLIERETPRVLQNSDVAKALEPATAIGAKGAALKRLDDTLDGLTCAMAAYLMWKDPSQWKMIGDLNGYIVVPRSQDT